MTQRKLVTTLPKLYPFETGWISAPTLALNTGYTLSAIYSWIKRGKIEARNFNGHYMVREDQALPPPKGD